MASINLNIAMEILTNRGYSVSLDPDESTLVASKYGEPMYRVRLVGEYILEVESMMDGSMVVMNVTELSLWLDM